jgi:hypothetical protein
MTSHVTRLYITAASVLGFFLAWAGIAAHPWSAPPAQGQDTTAAALAQYEQRLQVDAALIQQLQSSRGARTAAPPVRIVTLPPLTTTRSS